MLNCTNNTEFDQNIVTFEIILYIPLTFLGIVCNTAALWVFYFKLSRWTETRVYMISLAMADYTTVFTLPFIMFFHHQKWHDGYFCRIVEAIYYINMPISIYTITIIAVDRYVAIKHPLKAKVLRSPRKAAISCLFIWLCCMAWMTSFGSVMPINPGRYCFYSISQDIHFAIPIVTAIFLLTPVVILTFCSTQVIRCLKQKQNTSPQEETLTQKAICIVAVNMGTFIICFLPFNITMLVAFAMHGTEEGCCPGEALNKTIHVTTCIQNLNCCLDAFCYYFVAKEFREAISFKSAQSNSGVSQDSQPPSKSGKMVSGCM